MRLALALGLTSLASLGCRTPTQATVEVTTDVPCGEVSGTTITVAKLGALESSPPTTAALSCTNGRVGALVVVPSAGRSDEFALRVVTGVKTDPNACVAPDYKGCMVARRVLHFIEHTELSIPILMRRSCLDVPCNEAQTCVKGKCVSSTIDARTCVGGGCDEDKLSSSDAGVDGGDGGDGATDTGLPITGDTSGLLAGSPWPMLNGSPTMTGSTKLVGPKTKGLLWEAPAPAAATAHVVGKDGLVVYGVPGVQYFAIDPVTHKQKWSAAVKSGGLPGDPALGSDGNLYVVENGGLVALDPTSGAQLWSLPTKATGDLTLGPGPRAYLAGANGVSAVDVVARKEAWSDLTMFADSGPSLSSDGKLYVGSSTGQLRQYDAKTGAIGWTFTAFGEIRTPTVVGENGLVYTVGKSRAHAVDVVTGLERWHTDLGAAVQYSLGRGPSGTLYVATTGGSVLALDPVDGKVLSSVPLGGSFTAPFVIDRDGVVFVANDASVFALDGKDLKKTLFSIPALDVVALAPGADNVLYVLRTGQLMAIGP